MSIANNLSHLFPPSAFLSGNELVNHVVDQQAEGIDARTAGSFLEAIKKPYVEKMLQKIEAEGVNLGNLNDADFNALYAKIIDAAGLQAIQDLELRLRSEGKGRQLFHNIYEAIAKDRAEQMQRNDLSEAEFIRRDAQNLDYLTQISTAIDFDADIRNAKAAAIKEFTSAANMKVLGMRWEKEYGHLGKLDALITQMQEGREVDAFKKKAVIGFLAEVYARQVDGITGEIKVNWFEEVSGVQGFYKDTGSGTTEINLNALAENFKKGAFGMIGTQGHEFEHAYQAKLAKAFGEGKIKENNPLYDAARMYRAQFDYYIQSRAGNIGHLNAAYQQGRITEDTYKAYYEYLCKTHQAYEKQTIEASANFAGDALVAGLGEYVNGMSTRSRQFAVNRNAAQLSA